MWLLLFVFENSSLPHRLTSHWNHQLATKIAATKRLRRWAIAHRPWFSKTACVWVWKLRPASEQTTKSTEVNDVATSICKCSCSHAADRDLMSPSPLHQMQIQAAKRDSQWLSVMSLSNHPPSHSSQEAKEPQPSCNVLVRVLKAPKMHLVGQSWGGLGGHSTALGQATQRHHVASWRSCCDRPAATTLVAPQTRPWQYIYL